MYFKEKLSTLKKNKSLLENEEKVLSKTQDKSNKDKARYRRR